MKDLLARRENKGNKRIKSLWLERRKNFLLSEEILNVVNRKVYIQ